jgi:hypothetical protein
MAPVLTDCTSDVAALLNAVDESKGLLNQAKIVLLLRGSSTSADLKCKGAGKEKSAKHWKLLHRKVQPEYLKVKDKSSKVAVFCVTPKGRAVMHAEAKAMLALGHDN